MANDLSGAMTSIVSLLEPFSPEERARVVNASLMLLGDEAVSMGTQGPPSDPNSDTPEAGFLCKFQPKAVAWLKKNELSKDELEHCLHFDDGVVTPLELPGNASKRIQQVLHTYLIMGVAALLETGEASYSDSDARKLCEHFGCYDSTNHAKALKAFGNKIVGSKSAGWKLTTPGLTAAAELLKSNDSK